MKADRSTKPEVVSNIWVNPALVERLLHEVLGG